VPGADNWDAVAFDMSRDVAGKHPRIFYYSNRFAHDFGIDNIKAKTVQLLGYFPRARSGANFSPHHGCYYLNDVHQWVHAFRDKALILPWSEDYAWQMPMGSQQMTIIPISMFRAGLRKRPADPILWTGRPLKNWLTG
jgi:hypothetical protein